MKSKGKHWVFGLSMAALMAISSISMPVMAERMISTSVDDVQVEQVGEFKKKATTVQTDIVELKGYWLSSTAQARLEAQARAAFLDVFGIEIPSDHQAIEAQAYEEEGDMRYALSLMPKDWEASVDALAAPQELPFYAFLFGDVNIDTGDAQLLGIERFILNWDQTSLVEVDYSEQQIKDMENVARAFAAEQGTDVLELVRYDKVSGSYPQGVVLTFSLDAGKTLSVTVSEQGEVSGYSFIPGKG